MAQLRVNSHGLSAGGAGSFPTVGTQVTPSGCVAVGPLLPGEVLCGTDLYGDTVGNLNPATVNGTPMAPKCMSGDTLTSDVDGNYICVPGTGMTTVPPWALLGLVALALVMFGNKR